MKERDDLKQELETVVKKHSDSMAEKSAKDVEAAKLQKQVSDLQQELKQEKATETQEMAAIKTAKDELEKCNAHAASTSKQFQEQISGLEKKAAESTKSFEKELAEAKEKQRLAEEAAKKAVDEQAVQLKKAHDDHMAAKAELSKVSKDLEDAKKATVRDSPAAEAPASGTGAQAAAGGASAADAASTGSGSTADTDGRNTAQAGAGKETASVDSPSPAAP